MRQPLLHQHPQQSTLGTRYAPGQNKLHAVRKGEGKMKQYWKDSVQELTRENKNDAALELIRRTETVENVSPERLVWKSRMLQLVDQSSPEEVEATLKNAIRLDPSYAEAYIELGWFLLNVQDSPTLAYDAFRQAFELQVATNSEIVLGLLKCSKEVKLGQTASTLKDALLESLVDAKTIDEGMNE